MSVDFAIGILSGGSPREVTFTDETSPSALSWIWNFGEASSATSGDSLVQNPSHIYSADGSYTVSLTAAFATNWIPSINNYYLDMDSNGIGWTLGQGMADGTAIYKVKFNEYTERIIGYTAAGFNVRAERGTPIDTVEEYIYSAATDKSIANSCLLRIKRDGSEAVNIHTGFVCPGTPSGNNDLRINTVAWDPVNEHIVVSLYEMYEGYPSYLRHYGIIVKYDRDGTQIDYWNSPIGGNYDVTGICVFSDGRICVGSAINGGTLFLYDGWKGALSQTISGAGCGVYPSYLSADNDNNAVIISKVSSLIRWDITLDTLTIHDSTNSHQHMGSTYYNGKVYSLAAYVGGTPPPHANYMWEYDFTTDIDNFWSGQYGVKTKTHGLLIVSDKLILTTIVNIFKPQILTASLSDGIQLVESRILSMTRLFTDGIILSEPRVRGTVRHMGAIPKWTGVPRIYDLLIELFWNEKAKVKSTWAPKDRAISRFK